MMTMTTAAAVLAEVCRRDMSGAAQDDRLADLGVDSLSRVLLAVLIEDATGRAVPDAVLRQLLTVADVAQLLEVVEP